MKKICVYTFLCVAAISANAQLKVASNGNIGFKTQLSPLSPISLNCAGDTAYLISAQNNNASGVSINIANTVPFQSTFGSRIQVSSNADCYVYGINVHSSGAQLTGSCGTYGIVARAETGARSIALSGRVGTCGKGAAVYGTVNSNMGTSIPSGEIYAGFFNGNVGTTGNLTVNGSINGIVLGQSSNALMPLDAISQDNRLLSGCISEKISTLQAAIYEKESTFNYQRESDEDDLRDDSIDESNIIEPNLIEKQSLEKKHYALSAEQLEKVFPDLVYEKEDGSKVINYMEMIPLLVQTINELQKRITNLEGEEEYEFAKSRRYGHIATINDATIIPSVPSLAQNTPNPFTERTTIRFTLPDDTKNACICIFDMSGKMLKQIPVDATMQSITIEGYELQAGMYIYSLVVNGKEMDTKRMILSK
jgi:hypothetical protein